MANTVQYIYEVLDRFSGPLRKFKQQTDKASRSIDKIKRKADKVSESLQDVGGAIGGAAIVGGMAALVRQSVRVEDALADIARVSDVTEEQLTSFEKSMESLSEELGKDKIGLLQQGFEGLKLGIPLNEIDEFVRLSARTAVAFDIADQQAGSSLGSIRTKIGLTTKETGALMDRVNFLADNFAANGARMVEIIERTSGTMKTLEFSPDVIAGLAGFADQLEVTEELAASGLNQIFARMQKHPKLVKKLMEDPVVALKDVFEKFGKIDPAKRFAAVEKQFGLEAARFMTKAVTSVELFDKTMAAASSQEAFGSMMREMENRAGRSSTVFSILWNTVKNTFEALGDVLKPAAVTFAKIGTHITKLFKKFVEVNPAIIKLVGSIALFVASIAAVSLPIGIMITMISALLTPVTLVIAGIVALAGVISAAIYYSKPLTDTISGLIDDFGELGTELLALMEVFGLAGEGSFQLSEIFALIGLAISNSLVPIRIAIKLLTTLVGLARDVFSGNFSNIPGRIGDLVSDTGGIVGEALSKTAASFGLGEAPSAEQGAIDRASKTVNNQVTTTGEIRVKAERGATVTGADLTLNGGNNLATIY